MASLGGAWDDLYGLGNKLPKDPAGTPFITGDSSNPLDLLTGKSTLGPDTASTANLTAAMNRAFGMSDAFGGERANYATHYNPGRDDMLANKQNNNIRSLEDTVAGRTPSPAELQLREQASRNAAGAYGQAAALQGRNPGAALRAALDSSFRTNADANIQAGIRRAADQQAAQQALVQALATARGQGQNLLTADNDWLGKLLNAQVQATKIGADAAGDQFKAENTNAAAKNQFNSDIGGMIAKAFA